MTRLPCRPPFPWLSVLSLLWDVIWPLLRFCSAIVLLFLAGRAFAHGASVEEAFRSGPPWVYWPAIVILALGSLGSLASSFFRFRG